MSDAETVGVRRWRRRYFRLVAVGTVAGAGLGVGAVVLRHHGDPGRRPISPWILLALVGGLLIFTAGAAAVSWRVHSRSPDLRRLAAAPPGSGRQLGRDLKAGRPLTAEQRELAQAAVDRQGRSGWLALGIVLLGVFFIAYALLLAQGLDRWIRLGIGVVYLATAVLAWSLRRSLLRRAAAQGITPAPRDRNRRSARS